MYENKYAKIARQIAFWILIIVILLFTLFPFYWAIVGSFKSEPEIKTPPATYFPQRFVLNNYAGEFNDPVTGQVLPRGVFRNSDFLNGLFNSAIVSGLTVVTSLVVGSFAAYAIGRLRFRGRTVMLYLILAMTMFPLISILSGLFTIVRELGIFG